MTPPIRRGDGAFPVDGEPAEPVPPPSARGNDSILFVGLNPGSAREASSLEQRAQVVAILDEPFRSTRLGSDSAVRAFAAGLGLHPPQAQALHDLLMAADPLVRDELSQLASLWSKAERGGEIPSRLVLSGHSLGEAFFGEGNGVLRLDHLQRLAALMPRAAGQIEDVHVASCYSGFDGQLERYRAMFPGLKTLWAYAGSAPGSASGALVHERIWEARTRGRAALLPEGVARGTRKGENVATWSTGGPARGQGNDLAQARADLAALDRTLRRFDAGEVASPDPQAGELRAFYDRLQRVLQHADLPAFERPALRAQRDRALRLLYLDQVEERFADAYRPLIVEGYQSLGLTPPRLAGLSRRELLDEIGRFSERRAAFAEPPPEATRLEVLLRRGLVELDPALIPERWL